MIHDFKETKKRIIELIKNKNEITSKTEYKTKGIYLLYVDNFSDEKILPIYIGKVSGKKRNFQLRHKEHMMEIMALNRFTKEYYEFALDEKYFHGKYKICKIFKYMIEHNCELKDLHMIILEELEDDEEISKTETEYINNYNCAFFGFNQLNTITQSLQEKNERKYKETVRNELKKITENIDYGYGIFNYWLAQDFFKKYTSIEHDIIKKKQPYSKIKNIIEGLKEEHYPKKYLLPKIDYDAYPLKDTFDYNQMEQVNNELFLHISYSNHGKSEQQYPEIIRIRYEYDNKTKDYFLKSNITNKKYEGIYIIKNTSYFSSPTIYNIKKIIRGIDCGYMISTAMEYKHGINEYTLKHNKLYSLEEVFHEINSEVKDDVKIVIETDLKRDFICECQKTKYKKISIVKKIIKDNNNL